MGKFTGKGLRGSLQESVAQASAAVARPRQAICFSHGCFELLTRCYPDARARWEVQSRGKWKQETDISRAVTIHLGKVVLAIVWGVSKF